MSYEKAITPPSTMDKVIRTRVLIVDDDSTCLAVIAALLKLFNYAVVTTNCPIEALSILRKSHGTLNLVLSDVHMPLMNGLDLQKIVEEDFQIPVVLMSADNKRHIMMESLENGAAFYIVKPLKLEDVNNLWQHAIPKKQSKAIDSFGREVGTCNGVVATDAGTSNFIVATEVTPFNNISTIDPKTGNAQVAIEDLVATGDGINEGAGTSNGQVATDVGASSDMEATKAAPCNDIVATGDGNSNSLVATNSLQGVQINAPSINNLVHLENQEQPIANLDGNPAPSKPKKRKMTWTDELHDKFLKAIDHLGIGKAVPKKILECMNVPGLTRENIASHLQKYRIYTRRGNDSNGAMRNGRPLNWNEKPFRSSFSWGQFPNLANNDFLLNYSHAPSRNLHPPPRPMPTNYGQFGDNKSLVNPPYVGSQGFSLNHTQSNRYLEQNTFFQQNNQIQPVMNAYCINPTNTESNYNLHRTMTNLEGPLLDRQNIVSDANQGDLARAALQFLHPKPNLGYFSQVDNISNCDDHLMTSRAQKNMQILQPQTPFEMNNNVNPFKISNNIAPEHNHMSHGGSLVANGSFGNNHQENRLFLSNQRFNDINNGLMDPYQFGNRRIYSSHGMVGNAQEHVKLRDHSVIQGQLMEQDMNTHSNLASNVFSGEMGIANFGTPINQVQMSRISTNEPVIMPNLSNISPMDQPLNIPFMNDMLTNGQQVDISNMNTTSIDGRSLSISNTNVSVNPQVDISNMANISTNGQPPNVISILDTICNNAQPVMPSTDLEHVDGNPIIAANGETMPTTDPPTIPSNMDDVFGTDMSMFMSNTNVPIIVGGGAEANSSSSNNHGKEISTFGFTSTSLVHVHDWTSNQFNDFSMDYGIDDFSTIFSNIDSHDGNNNT